MPINTYKQRYILGLFCLLLSSCSLFLPKQDERQALLAQLQHWDVRGKLSIRHHQEGITGYLNWQQNKHAFSLYIAGPLAQGATRIQGNDKQVSLQLATWQKPQTAKSGEVLMQKHLGWSFPLNQLRYWIKGIDNPKMPAQNITYDNAGYIERIQQDDWTIRLSRYQYQSGHYLPSLIKITGKDYRFILSIKSWTLYD